MDVHLSSNDALRPAGAALLHPWSRRNRLWSHLRPLRGFSRHLRRAAGGAPFRELLAHGELPPLGAVHTSAGDLAYDVIIHVDLPRRPSRDALFRAAANVIRVLRWLGLESISVPVRAFVGDRQRVVGDLRRAFARAAPLCRLHDQERIDASQRLARDAREVRVPGSAPDDARQSRASCARPRRGASEPSCPDAARGRRRTR